MAKLRSSRWALRRGQKLARAGKVDKALAAFDSAGDTSDFQLLLHHALTLARAASPDAALETAARAAAAAPDDPVPAFFHAYLMLRFGRADEAGPELERAGTLAPANPMGRSLDAAREVLSGDAAAGCHRLLAGPRTDNLEILGWVLAVIERKLFEAAGTDTGAIPPEIEGAAERDVPPDAVGDLPAGMCAKRGRKLLESGRPKAAAKYLARSAELRPDDADERAMLGAALFEAGEFDRAAAELAGSPKKGPLAGVAQFYRAAAAYRLGRYDEAMEWLDTLPLTGDAFFYKEWRDYVRGMTLVALGRTDEAAPLLAAFLDTEPDLLDRRLRKAAELLARRDPCSTPS